MRCNFFTYVIRMSEQVSTNWLSEIQMFDVTTSTKEGSSALCDLDGDVAGCGRLAGCFSRLDGMIVALVAWAVDCVHNFMFTLPISNSLLRLRFFPFIQNSGGRVAFDPAGQ